MFKKGFGKQCRHATFKGTVIKRPVQKQTHRKTQKHAEHQDATDIDNKLFFFFFSDFYFLFYL